MPILNRTHGAAYGSRCSSKRKVPPQGRKASLRGLVGRPASKPGRSLDQWLWRRGRSMIELWPLRCGLENQSKAQEVQSRAIHLGTHKRLASGMGCRCPTVCRFQRNLQEVLGRIAMLFSFKPQAGHFLVSLAVGFRIIKERSGKRPLRP